MVDGNSLTGALPTELGLITSLEILCERPSTRAPSATRDITLDADIWVLRRDATNNDLSGSIPTEMGLLTAMQYL
jgi:hypothetical protein